MFSYARYSFLIIALAGIVSCQSKANTIQIGDHVFHVDFAATQEQKTKGLMFVETIPDDYGMVFLYDKPAIQKFWMRNTLIPLDMLFFDRNGRLAHIEHNARPHDLTPRGPDIPVCSVVEINGGQAEKRGIDLGDVLIAKELQECLQSSGK